jgi:hypothetical protein
MEIKLWGKIKMMKKTVDHIPVHLRPPEIPRLKNLNEKSDIPIFFKRHFYFLIISAIIFPFLGFEFSSDEGEGDDYGQ